MSALFPLVAKAAEVRTRGTRLIGPVDLTRQAHGTTIVMGPNGSGKTSLLRMLHGLARLSAGHVTWACPVEDARPQQAFVFQTPVMLRRSVEDNLAYPLRLMNVPKAQARARARDWAARIGLGDALTRSALKLSGGERQKLALARALIRDPRVLFLDEPCAALDGKATREIEALLMDAAASGARLIMSTHNIGQARRLADDVLFLLGGRIHEAAPAPDFFTSPNTPEAHAFLKGDIVE